jgi:hypothetical protein
MDQETLTNHIAGLGKDYFKGACKIVLTEVFHFRAINVDGSDDGGTDFSSFEEDGTRRSVSYQISTQKSDVKGKAYRDAKKSIEKLGSRRFYFLTTYILPQTQITKLEVEISDDLDIPTTCLSANQIAGLILSEGLLNRLLDEINYPLPRDYSAHQFDYKEMALHSYTLLSDDATHMKGGIYDDSFLFVLSNEGPLHEDELISKVKSLLGLGDIKDDILKRRVGALFGKSKLKRLEDGKAGLSEESQKDVDARKRIYEIELSSLAAAQTDLLRNDYNLDWSIEDSKKVALWVAEAFIAEQISNLKEVKASIISNPIFRVDHDGVNKIREYLQKSKHVSLENSTDILPKLLALASNHPLITKLTRASIYVALEGANPISSAKALGANRWSDFDILVEPTVAIPYLCSRLYKGFVNRFFAVSVKSIERAQKLDARLFIPYFYINECAGHLLTARKYCNLNLNPTELQFSSNAFVANYYAQKQAGITMPDGFMDYLATFSPAIKTERSSTKEWVRSIMTDLQSLLAKSNVHFIQVPFYTHDDCVEFEKDYMFKHAADKPVHLVNHDIWALQFTNDEIIRDYKHWILLTYDRSLISMSQTDAYKGWVANPFKFLDMTEIAKPLSETELVSLVHSVATYSETTLSAGARVMDRIVKYASGKMQNWEFAQEIDEFKQQVVNTFNSFTSDMFIEVDKKTDEFLKRHGIELVINEVEDTDG